MKMNALYDGVVDPNLSANAAPRKLQRKVFLRKPTPGA
jgi:hypothetical protein